MGCQKNRNTLLRNGIKSLRAEAALFRKLDMPILAKVDAAPVFSTVVAKLRKAATSKEKDIEDSDSKKRKRT